MAGSFGSISNALSALRYNQVALDVANNNISNATTEGYARRRVVAESIGAPSVPALWSRYDGYGGGVGVGSVDRMVDPLLDTRVRREHAALSYLSTSQTVLSRVEEGIGEPGENGVAAAIDLFTQSWQDLANNPGSDAARQQVLGRAASLAQAITVQVNNVAGEEGDQRVHLLNAVSEINTVAADLAGANRAIFENEANGTDVSTQRDLRDQLALRLAELSGGVATVRPDGMFDVTVNGVALVTGGNAHTLAVTGGVNPDGTAGPGPITFAIDTGVSTPVAGLSGELGALTELLTTTLPGYRTGLDSLARNLADTVNTQHGAGFDAAGAAGGPLFTYDATRPGASLAVAITDPARVAAAAVPGGTLDGGNADALTSASDHGDEYQQLVNGFGTQVAALNRQVANQGALAGSLDRAWEQQAGVNLDEEMVNMVTAQRAYEAAARLMTTLDQVLDTLINRTGLVGR